MMQVLSSLALAMLLASGPALTALAQTESPAPEDTSPAVTEQAQDKDAPPVDVEPGEPLLDDYEASEQISEDLSVSFPVDI